jgi:hypothetical protein
MTIPVSEIDRLEENTVYLKLDRGQVEALRSLHGDARPGLQSHK